MTYKEKIEKLGISAGMRVSREDAAAIAAEADAEIARLRGLCETAHAHVLELRDAWERGSIREIDNLGGTRSNCNVDVEVALRAAKERL